MKRRCTSCLPGSSRRIDVTTPAPLTLHGVLLEVHGIGVLLTGSSGVGKSELALELLARGHKLVADDAAQVARRGRKLVGTCPPLLSGFLEARSLGILNVRRLFGAGALRARTNLELVIELDLPEALSDSGLERLSGRRGARAILGVDVAEISIPIRLGHNLAVLVEAAARDHQLRSRGYHADADLSARQLRAMKVKRGRR
jgi:serine kinase of HPr protein (carbohydrate metabolism regulator)